MGVESILSLDLLPPNARYASLLAHGHPSPLQFSRRLIRLSVRADGGGGGGGGERWRSFGDGGAMEQGSGLWGGEEREEGCRGGRGSEALVGGGGGGRSVGLPISLKMLKRRQKKKKAAAAAAAGGDRLKEMGNSLVNAFSNMVFMVRTLQSHSLRFRQNSLQQEMDVLLRQVHRDLHASFLWLFQQVFSCTPQLMILLMILLADFTASSTAAHLSPPPPPPEPPSAALPLSSSAPSSPLQGHLDLALRFPSRAAPAADAGGGGGNLAFGDGGSIGGGGRRLGVASGEDGSSGGTPDRDAPFGVSTAVYSDAADLSAAVAPPVAPTQDSAAADMQNLSAEGRSSAGELPESASSSEAAAEWAYEELSKVGGGAQLLASASASEEGGGGGEGDRNGWYERTDLCYQYAISNDSDNAMLLANYAQFLFVVRKDYDRAEELFRRAVRCDPSDGSAASRLAAFLWVARRDLAAAEAAYVAAIRAEPGNSYNAANYAHFLWSSEQ